MRHGSGHVGFRVRHAPPRGERVRPCLLTRVDDVDVIAAPLRVQRPRVEVADQAGAEHRDGVTAHGATAYSVGQEHRNQEHRSTGIRHRAGSRQGLEGEAASSEALRGSQVENGTGLLGDAGDGDGVMALLQVRGDSFEQRQRRDELECIDVAAHQRVERTRRRRQQLRLDHSYRLHQPSTQHVVAQVRLGLVAPLDPERPGRR